LEVEKLTESGVLFFGNPWWPFYTPGRTQGIAGVVENAASHDLSPLRSTGILIIFLSAARGRYKTYATLTLMPKAAARIS